MEFVVVAPSNPRKTKAARLVIARSKLREAEAALLLASKHYDRCEAELDASREEELNASCAEQRDVLKSAERDANACVRAEARNVRHAHRGVARAVRDADKEASKVFCSASYRAQNRISKQLN
jgi:hypothetical protein